MDSVQSFLRCRRCSSKLLLRDDGLQFSCACGITFPVTDDIVAYSDPEKLKAVTEVGARDRQASGYLEHAKFPTQVSRVTEFLAGLPEAIRKFPAIDLGCGPGPYTGYLLEAGFEVIAVDFSRQSLRINQERSAEMASRACFVEADLNDLQMAHGFAGVLLMCDFLQHLDSHKAREGFVRKAFSWLAPGGQFYLSFFNFNIVNFLKGDLRGTFSNGTIRYERLMRSDVLAMLPENAVVDRVTPLNIFHSAGLDYVPGKMPGAKYLARMTAISGHAVEK